MARPDVIQEGVERGIQRRTRTYDDGRVVVSHRIIYADATGETITRTVKQPRPTTRGNITTECSLAHARAELAKAREEVRKGEHVAVKKKDSNVTFEAVANHWLDHSTHLRASTREGHRIMIAGRLRPLHSTRMKGLSYSVVQDFQTSLAHLAPATQRQTMRVVKSICQDAVKRGLLVSNPCRDLNRIAARRVRVTIPTEQEVEALIKRLASPQPFQSDAKTPSGRVKLPREVDPRWPLLVEAAAFTGLRAGELAALRVRDLDVRARSLTVALSIPTKGHVLGQPKSDAGLRQVDDLDPDLCRLMATLAAGKQPGDYLFGWEDGEGISQPYNHLNFYRRHFQPACQELGIQCRFHDLRHFFASLLIADGEDLIRVAALLGHSSAAFTLTTYGHLVKREPTGRGVRIQARRAEVRGDEPKPKPKGRGKPF